ncbi:MAG: AMP-binding protein, partial [Coraliomargarita sp.]|nr:AMP-binding protein [Coraliomargarita sp.]
MESVSHEQRTFAPVRDFAENAHIGSMDAYQALYSKSIADPEAFWAEAAQELHWFKKWDRVLDASDAPHYKWFSGAQTNVCYNCVARHLDGPNRNKAAIIWEGEPGETRVLTYQDVHREVCKFANGLKQLGIKKGDRV